MRDTVMKGQKQTERERVSDGWSASEKERIESMAADVPGFLEHLPAASIPTPMPR